jgi:hypothetical protein
VATDGIQQVGMTGSTHPALWSGSSSSFVDLTPPGWIYPATVTGVDAGIQTGTLAHQLATYAVYWTSDPAAVTYLNPPGVSVGQALAVHAGHEVGSVQFGSEEHACVWSGSAASFVDLHPAGLGGSTAFAVHGNMQAGIAWLAGGALHASLWAGTAASWIDLNPVGADQSRAYGVSDTYQVGQALIGGWQHASVWSGSANSWFDLHATLPPTSLSSHATGVWTDSAGVTYISGFADQVGAVIWVSTTSGSPFCSGDGSGTACPCGNDSPAGSGSGCLNSFGSGGLLAASGVAGLTADSLLLSGSGMTNGAVLYFQGTAESSNGNGAVFGDGLLCANGTVVRLMRKTNVGGGSHDPGAGDAPLSVQGLVAVPGVRTYQAWYRNAVAFCTPSTFNLTNGIEVTWQP